MISQRPPARRRAVLASLAVMLCLGSLSVGSTSSVAATASEPAVGVSGGSDSVPAADRARVLGVGYRNSADRAVVTEGDGTGLHVLVADARDGMQWRTAATLSEPSFVTRQWIGQSCLTMSGTRAVVVYAPVGFADDAVASRRGAFAAVVDLDSGQVSKLPLTTSLGYFNPGCGSGEQAVLTQEGDETLPGTRLTVFDARSPVATASVIRTSASLSSPVPTASGVVAADGAALVTVRSDGTIDPIVSAAGTPSYLTVDAAGAVLHTDFVNGTARIRRSLSGVTTTLGYGPQAEVTTRRGTGGTVYLTGPVTTAGNADSVTRLPDVGRSESLSTRGMYAFSVVDPRDAGNGSAPAGTTPTTTSPDHIVPVAIHLRSRSNAQQTNFRVSPGDVVSAAYRSGQAMSPALPAATAPSPGKAASSSDAVDADRYCSVPRNDVAEQVYQPTARQVEWAADQAVRGALTGSYSPAGSGLAPYSPQGLSPLPALTGGGNVPAQILLGVLAQESNMQQASPYAATGEFGNPLVGNFYGRDVSATDDSTWVVDFTKSDCGYGVSQQTDGMRLAGRTKPGETAFSPTKQKAIALDYRANIAAGLRTLVQKWNETRGRGMKVNNGPSSSVESWYFALWDYNTGYHHMGDADTDGTVEGLGWANNPVNPHYRADRAAFLDVSYADAAHPQDWPYQEKVIGWAGHPLESSDGGAGYRAAWWNSADYRSSAEPPTTIACTAANQCYPGLTFTPNDRNVAGEPPGPCGHLSPQNTYNLQCYWHAPVTWKNCNRQCGYELLRFDPGYAEQPNGVNYPPTCTADTAALSAQAKIVDDITPSQFGPRCSSRAGTYAGFSLNFAQASDGQFWSKVDWHQLGGGFNGHLWFTHTRRATDVGGALKVTGTWAAPASAVGWTRIKVYVPDHAAWTRQADYVIDARDGVYRHRVVNQASHVRDADDNWAASGGQWKDVGVFNLAGGSSVSLSNVTPDGGEDDVAFDAIAFIPAAAPTVSMVAMGDSYSAGEGVEPYDADSDVKNGAEKDACHRSANAYGRLVTSPGHAATIAAESTNPTGSTSFAFIACSGAETVSMTADAVDNPVTAADTAGHTDWGSVDHHSGELPQLDQGYLDENTTLVTLSIGGNDARFADIIHGCLLTLEACSASTYRLTRDSNKSVDPAVLSKYESTVITSLLPAHLKAVYNGIHAKAPRARIVVVGYPQLYLDDSAGGGCQGVVATSQQLLNTFATALTASIKKAVTAVKATGVDIGFVDPTPGYRAGPHFICDSGGTTVGAWLNGVVAFSQSGSSGDSTDVPGTGSFHPRLQGQQYYAGLVNSALTQ